MGAAVVVDGVDRPHAIAGLARRLRLGPGPGVPRELPSKTVAHPARSPDGGEEPADSVECAAKAFARLADARDRTLRDRTRKARCCSWWFLLLAMPRDIAVTQCACAVAK